MMLLEYLVPIKKSHIYLYWYYYTPSAYKYKKGRPNLIRKRPLIYIVKNTDRLTYNNPLGTFAP